MSSSFLNRMLGTNDGTTGITPVGGDGQIVRNVSDRTGRLWVRIFQGSAPADAANPVPVAVQSSALPLGAATEATAAASDTKLGTIITSLGTLATQTTLALVQTATSAAATVLGATSDAADRVGGTTTVNAKLRGLNAMLSGGLVSVDGAVVRGAAASNGVISGAATYPHQLGGRARDITNLPTAVTSDRAVGATFSLQGEQFVALSTPIAGEDRTNNMLIVTPSVNALQSPNKYSRAHTASTSATLLQAKASAGNLYSFRATNLSDGWLYFYVINKASNPANGDASYVAIYPVGPNCHVGDDWPGVGLSMGTGISFAWSTNITSLTLAAGGPITALYG
jgi:hypothetical protein